MRSVVGVARTDEILDCIATGGILKPSALVKAPLVPSLVHASEISCTQILKLTKFIVQLPKNVYSLIHPSAERHRQGYSRYSKTKQNKQCSRRSQGKEQNVCLLSTKGK